MGRYYSVDLRQRVVDAIDGGLSARAAAARFSIGISTAIKWHQRWRKEKTVEPAKQGHPPGSKLDAHEDFILSLVEDKKDIALHEIAETLEAERNVKTCAATVWYFFAKRGLTHKKRLAMPVNNSEQMFWPAAKNGSNSKQSLRLSS